MAVIRYPLVDRTTPSYITDGGYFLNDSDGTRIGIGSGGGTELSKSELITYVLALHGSVPFVKNLGHVETRGDMTDAEVTTMVNTWCSDRGIS
jgi:hypothetical protein